MGNRPETSGVAFLDRKITNNELWEGWVVHSLDANLTRQARRIRPPELSNCKN